MKYSPSGALLTQWGSTGGGDGRFFYPTGIAVDRDGNVFVAEPGEHMPGFARIQKFGPWPTRRSGTARQAVGLGGR